MKTFNLKSITLVLFLLSASLQVWALTNTPQVRGFMNSWSCTAMTQSSNNSNIYYYEATSNGEFKVTDGCNWDNDKNLSYYDNSKGNVTLSGNNTGGNLSCSQAGTWYICFDSSDSKVYATTTNPDAGGGGGGGSLDADLIAVLNGTKIMVYGGELTSWNQSNYYFMTSNNTSNAVATATKDISSLSINNETYWFGAVTISAGTYYQGHWASGLSCAITAGNAYVVRGGSPSTTYFELKAGSTNNNAIYRVKKASSTSPTISATTTIDASITQGSSISISTSTSAGVSVLNKSNTLKYYLYDGSDWSELTVSAGSADVSSLAVGTDYKIVTVLYDGYIYVKADEDSFSVTASETYYTLTYGSGSNGSVSAKNASTNADVSSGASILSGTQITFTATPNSHYKLKGWYSNSGCTTAIAGAGTTNPYTRTITATQSVYAAFELNTCAITIDRNGGTAGATSVTATYGSTLPNFTASTRTGYTLNGYYTNSSGGTKIINADGTLVASTSYANSSKQWNSDASSLTLHAQWTQKMTTVTINVSPSGSGTLTVGGSAFTAGSTTTAGVTTSRTVVATALPGYKFNNYTTSGNATGTASSNTYTLKGNGSGSTGTLTANFIRTYAYIEGRFRVYNSTRTSYTTTYASGGQWDESSTRIQMNYDATNHRFYLNTYMTPKELSANHGTGCGDCKPYFYIKTSTSNSSLANVTSYLSSTATTLSAAGSANKKALGQSGSNSNLRFDSSDESGYVILYFDESGVWYELEIPEYTLTMAKGTGGASTSPAVGAHTITSAQAISATASSGYRFLNWTASPDANVTFASAKTTNSNSVTLKGNATVTANFEPTYTLTVTSQTGGSITAPSGGTATVGPSQTTTITATKSNGYTFAGWTKVSGTATITNTNSLSTTVTGVSANTTVRANFTQDNYTVTVNSTGGTISTPASGSYTGKHYGDKVAVTAVNTNAYAFVGWSASPAANATFDNAGLLSTNATIKGNVTLTAVFRLPITIYVSNEQCWDAVMIHAFDPEGGSVESTFPGNPMMQDGNGWWYYTFDKSITKVSFLFANSAGNKQTNDITGVTATTYYKTDPTDGNRNYTTTNAEYAPERCVEDYYTVIGDEAWLGSSWDLSDGANEMVYNSSKGRYELRKVNVNLPAGKKYYKIVKNGCYEGANCGQWPNGSGNAEANIASAGYKDLVFWLKTSDNTYGVEISNTATYYINHPWGDGNGSWSKVKMTYSGSGSTYTASGIFGANGADIYNGDTKVKYFANNNSEISGYNNVSAGDNVIFTYDASSNTLSVRCPTCITTTRYWICVPTTTGSTMPENATLMTYNSEDGLYYTDPDTQPFLWPNNGAKVNANNNCSDNWIDRNNIVNYASMTLGQKVQYIYDPDINQLTVVDANTPKLTLTATQAVNAEGTQSVITLTTTSSKSLTNATYTYTKLSGPDGTLAASATYRTTFTTTNEGTYRFQVSVTSDQGSFTATCTVKVKFKIIVYANVAAPGWSGTINMNYSNANHAMTQISGSNWYRHEVIGIASLTFYVRQGNSTGSYQTVNIGPIDDDICIIVNSDLQDSKRTYSATNDCELYMRFASTYTQYKGEQNTGESKTVYSNYFKHDGDEVSFYVGTPANVKYQTFNSATNKWNAGTTVSTGVSGGDVYAGEYNSAAGNKLRDLAAYKGEYYIRTDGANGGWTNYINENQAFFEFSRNDYFPNEWYNHYWCKWMDGNPNVKAVVANEINPALTDTLPDFVLTQGTNMRFEYDNSTNFIGRQFLKGSGGDFLRIFASDDDADNFIYKTDAPTTRIKKANAVTLNDKSDWVYQIDVKAKPSGSDVNVYVLGRYPVTRNGIGAASDQDNYLGGYEEDGVTPMPIKIMGSSTTPDTYNMRLIYDYKTNRVIAAWYPAGDEIGGTTTTVDANFLITREDDANAVTFDMTNNGARVVSINQMYSALIITKTAYNTRKSSGNYYYWVSLPYDVLVRDIFGINGYGKKWVVQRYRGDMRAKYGFRDDIETFWANMKQNATAKMEANRGYVIRLRLTDADFKEINGTSQVTLYFPSCNTEDLTLQNSTTALQSTVPSHLCEVVEPVSGKSRIYWDSHWNVIGQPGLKTMQMTNPTQLSPGAPAAHDNHPKFYYEWSWQAGAGKYTATAVSGAKNSFKTFYSYMVQFGGTLTWQQNIETIDPSLAPRRMPQAKQEDIVISLTASAEREVEHIVGEDLHSEYEQVTDFDRTILTMSEQGSDSFVLNQDMSKTKSGKLNIYTIFDKTNTAGKVIPMDTKEVPVVVEINYDNEVSFALDKDVSDKTITFIDYQEGTETILNYAPYTVSLSAGVYDQRFAIRISERSEIATDLSHATDDNSKLRLLQDGQMFYIEGLTEKQSLSIFDATGKCCLTTTVDNCERFSVPAQGIYLLQIDGQTFKVTTR